LADSKELSGVVLSRDPAGDRHLRIRIFDQFEGLKAVLFSLPGKRGSKTHPPDLFDDVECYLQPVKSESTIPFVTDFQIMRSYREFTVNPLTFLTASQIARFYLQNGDHLLEPAPRLKLLRSSLDSFFRAKLPGVVLLKLLYCFSRDEGLPVKESWISGLPNHLLNQTVSILKTPVSEIQVEQDQLSEILERLKLWINAETELIFE
jgi:hypothetical protein